MSDLEKRNEEGLPKRVFEVTECSTDLSDVLGPDISVDYMPPLTLKEFSRRFDLSPGAVNGILYGDNAILRDLPPAAPMTLRQLAEYWFYEWLERFRNVGLALRGERMGDPYD